MTKGSTTTNYNYDLNNRLLTEVKAGTSSTDTTTYFYDNNGNQLAKTTEAVANSTGAEALDLAEGVVDSELCTYNGFNQLVSLTNDTAAAAYTYRANGLRQSKTVGGVTTTHVWDGQNIVLDITGTNVVKYVRGANLIAQVTDTTTVYYLYDAHGNVVHLTNGPDGIAARYTYDAYGNILSSEGSITNPFKYCGEYLDYESGYIYLRGRYYDSRNGRFISEDPVHDYVNWYVYCANNPVMKIDPSGYRQVIMDDGSRDETSNSSTQSKNQTGSGSTKTAQAPSKSQNNKTETTSKTSTKDSTKEVVSTIVNVAKSVASAVVDAKIGETLVKAGSNIAKAAPALAGYQKVAPNSGRIMTGATKASTLGITSVLLLTCDIYQDVENYDGLDTAAAISIDVAAAATTLAFGLFCAASIGIPVVGLAITIGVAIATSQGASIYKDTLLNKK